LRKLAKVPSPALGPPEEPIPNCICTGNVDTNKSRIINALSQYLVRFRWLLKKHRSILNNLFTQFSTFSAANSQMRIAHKVKPSDFCNHPGEHLRKIATLEANIQGVSPNPPRHHFEPFLESFDFGYAACGGEFLEL
jgi:hypothetical protein